MWGSIADSACYFWVSTDFLRENQDLSTDIFLSNEPFVVLIHSSADLFLNNEWSYMWRERQHIIARRGFDVNVALLRALIFKVDKMLPDERGQNEWSDTIEKIMDTARHAEQSTGQTQTALLDDLDSKEGKLGVPFLENPHRRSVSIMHWCSTSLHSPGGDLCEYCPYSFLAFAVMNGLALYMRSKKSLIATEPEAGKKPLLLYAVIAPIHHNRDLHFLTIKTLLDNGADPNEEFEDSQGLRRTSWEAVYEYFKQGLESEVVRFHNAPWPHIFDLFIKYGARSR